jgi:hypothetical protein
MRYALLEANADPAPKRNVRCAPVQVHLVRLGAGPQRLPQRLFNYLVAGCLARPTGRLEVLQ